MSRVWWLSACMVLTALLSALWMPQPQTDALQRASVPLEAMFPDRFGDWRLDPLSSGVIRPAAEQARRFDMYDQLLERTYVNGQGQKVMLSVAYGRQQSVGLQMHLPEVCYQAGGFQVAAVQAGHTTALGRPLAVTRLFAEMAGRPEPITYWRTLGDEVVEDGQRFRWMQISLGLRRAIPDGMLVRVSSIDPDRPSAYRLQARFVAELAQAVPPEYRQRVLGQP